MKKICLKETLLFERTFEVIKFGLTSCRVSHFCHEIFGFIWYQITPPRTWHCKMAFWEIGNITEAVEQRHLKLCMYMCMSTNTKRANFLKDILVCLISHYAAWRLYAVELFTYQISQVRYAIAEKRPIFMTSGFSSNEICLFYIPFEKKPLDNCEMTNK